MLSCHGSCKTCKGPGVNECTLCNDGAKEPINGTCVCNSSADFYYSSSSTSTTDSCLYKCPDCNYTAPLDSTNCYYRDPVARRCVNPPTKNCSSPNLYGQPYELFNTSGTCVHNCSAGYFAVEKLMKCTSDCSQFNLYHYSGA